MDIVATSDTWLFEFKLVQFYLIEIEFIKRFSSLVLLSHFKCSIATCDWWLLGWTEKLWNFCIVTKGFSWTSVRSLVIQLFYYSTIVHY
jgi:hypothetical protein